MLSALLNKPRKEHRRGEVEYRTRGVFKGIPYQCRRHDTDLAPGEMSNANATWGLGGSPLSPSAVSTTHDEVVFEAPHCFEGIKEGVTGIYMP